MTRPEITETTDEGTVCSVDGAVVHVQRRHARGDVPAFEYTIGTDEESPVAVRLRQSLPDSVEPDALGFPPACEADWRLDESTLVFEAPIEPGEPVRTAWGVDADDHPGIEPPDIDVVPFDPSSAGAGGAAAERDDAAVGDDAAAGGDTGVEGDTEGGDAEDVPPTFDLEEPPEGLAEPGTGDPGGEGGSVAGAGGEDDAPDLSATGATAASASGPSAGETTLPSDGPLVAQLAAELQSGEVDEAYRAALQDGLAVRLSDSTNAFVEHLQEKLERRADRLADDVESLEASVERVYGVKADASEIDALKRGLAELDQDAVTAADVEEVRETTAEVSERVAEVESTAAKAEYLAELADRVGELRDEIQSVRASAASASEVEERTDELFDRLQTLEDEAATTADVEDAREAHRGALDATKSDVADLRRRLDSDYRSDAEVSAEIDRRIKRSLATLVLFGIGATGLLSTLPLALAGSEGAVVTFAGGAASILAWWAYLGRQGGFSRFRSSLPSPGDLLGE